MNETIEFYKSDYWETLFPLNTNRLLIVNFADEIKSFINERLNAKTTTFLSQKRVYATKPRWHLRRTVKLDPVAEFYIYDLMYRNRSICRKEVRSNRRSFGYRFANGAHLPITPAYKDFKTSIEENSKMYGHRLKFDISAYFNSIYHHHLTNWFNSCRDISPEDKDGFGVFCRAINAGVSVDFLPQGIYPSKMIGNEYLKYIDCSEEITSSVMVRFMDDFYLFDDSTEKLSIDFIKIQQLLGLHGLNINPAKTAEDGQIDSAESTVSRIQEELEEMMDGDFSTIEASAVFMFGFGYNEEDEDEDDENEPARLSQAQLTELLNHFRDPDLSESDAELILNCLKSNTDSIFDHLALLLSRFPNMSKQIALFARNIDDKETLCHVVLEFIRQQSFLLEYQVFWLAVLAEENLQRTSRYGQIMITLHQISQKFDYAISSAKILETATQNFGFKEIRSEFLRSGQSDWKSWSSAIGTRTLDPQERNYALRYFANGSDLNGLISRCLLSKDISN